MPCPACGRAVELGPAGPEDESAPPRSAYAPFCSRRCRLLDLGAWSDGVHVIPGRQQYLGDGEEEAP
ncbi:MAG: DNA gyrase inhibitor YacG [Planctomycetota bacterium]